MIRTTVVALALLAGGASAAQAAVLPAVVAETARSGWPHAVTQAEIRAVTDAVFTQAIRAASPRHRVAVRCWSGATIARSRCGVVVRLGKRRIAYRVNVKVWEDGSYRTTRVR